MSIVAGGKIKLAKDAGEPIPAGWVLDKEGRDTTDPAAFFNGGTLLPFGAYKGSGLAFMLEILAGALVGAAVMDELPVWFKETKAPVNIGHLFVAIDIGHFAGAAGFRKRLAGMIAGLKARSAEGRVCLPGEQEERIEAERLREGLPVSDELWGELTKIAAAFSEPLGAQGDRRRG
jgi:LDH2 family malate/lactate/ureidoglycolate dehydrogenase